MLEDDTCKSNIACINLRGGYALVQKYSDNVSSEVAHTRCFDDESRELGPSGGEDVARSSDHKNILEPPTELVPALLHDTLLLGQGIGRWRHGHHVVEDAGLRIHCDVKAIRDQLAFPPNGIGNGR